MGISVRENQVLGAPDLADLLDWLDSKDGAAGWEQFTMDWIESALNRIEGGHVQPHIAIPQLSYQATIVLSIMRPDLPDCAFFKAVADGTWQKEMAEIH